jgi:hypothetical protein
VSLTREAIVGEVCGVLARRRRRFPRGSGCRRRARGEEVSFLGRDVDERLEEVPFLSPGTPATSAEMPPTRAWKSRPSLAPCTINLAIRLL